MLDLQKIAYFVAIVDHHFNITKAAQELFISQPALSNAIKNMEQEEGVRLFVRNKGRYTALTPGGQYLYNEGILLLARHEKIVKQLHRIGNRYTHSIAVAAPPFLLRSYVSSILPPLNARFPHVEFLFHDSDHESIREGLLNRSIDIALMTEPNDYDTVGIRTTLIDHRKFTAILAKNHPLAHKALLDWEDIAQYPLSIPDSRFPTYSLIQGALRARRLEARIALSGSVWDFQVTILIGTDYIGLMPEIVQDLFTKEMANNLIAIPIKESVDWRVVFCENPSAHQSETVKAVRDYLLENLPGTLDEKKPCIR
ncbi:MAG: LysR family transcriptional regulator [Peptoniphilus sp.]|nr:LysR family transcriptional regulator [Peptoniphilus sp.]MDY3118064.1 LysR family transcriptional regulator [Peptoniphilus sp.]